MENCYLQNLGCTDITGFVYIGGIQNVTNLEKKASLNSNWYCWIVSAKPQLVLISYLGE